jgi:REP element-mobilizing transposase RayT
MSDPIPLHPGQYYHIYNRGNNRENVFREERNYPYFLKLYAKYIEPIAETYAYCLLRNHFHFLVRIKDEKDLTGFENLSGLNPSGLSQPFSNLFNAYARAFNKAYQRTGALFQRPFGRIHVASNAHLIQLVTYIHQNPQKHGFVTDFRDWPYTSYHALLSRQPTRLKRDEVLTWFEGAKHFADTHRQTIDERQMAALAPDDYT